MENTKSNSANKCPVCGENLKKEGYYFCENCGFNHNDNDNTKQKPKSTTDELD